MLSRLASQLEDGERATGSDAATVVIAPRYSVEWETTTLSTDLPQRDDLTAIQTAPLELRVDKNDLSGLATLVMDTHYAHSEYDALADSVGDSFVAATQALEQRTRQLGSQPSSSWFVYDGVEGGLGFDRAIYENFEALAERARDQLEHCQCGRPNGCPACTFDENCGNDNSPLLRASAIDVLDHLLGDVDADALDHLLGDVDADALEAHLSADDGGQRRPTIFYS